MTHFTNTARAAAKLAQDKGGLDYRATNVLTWKKVTHVDWLGTNPKMTQRVLVNLETQEVVVEPV